MSEISARANPLFLREEDLRQGIELLFFAYRYFTADPDEILARKGFGRAHHRVLHFLSRHPGISVAELLEILGITKQSLSRVLAQLVEDGYVEQQADQNDRRRRLLRLTELGSTFEREVSAPQRARVTRAYREAGAEAVAGYRKVLLGLIDEADRERILALVERT